MALTFLQLKTRVARALQDTGNTYWTAGSATAELDTYLNDGLRDFCRQTECLRQIVTLVASNFDTARSFAYWKPPTGVSVIAWYDCWNAGRPLNRTTSRDEGRLNWNWEDRTGTPLRYLLGLGGKGQLRVCPYPANDTVYTPWVASALYTVGTQVLSSGKVYTCITAGTASTTPLAGTSTNITDGTVHWTYSLTPVSNTLTALRAEVSYLAADLVADADVPAIPDEYHQALEDYAVYRALSRDGEKQDLDEAGRRAGLWGAAIQDAKSRASSDYSHGERYVVGDYF